MPAGWTVINDSTGGNGIFPTEWVVVEGSDPCGDYSGNMTGGTGPYAVANSDCPGSTVVLDTHADHPVGGFLGALVGDAPLQRGLSRCWATTRTWT